MVILDLIYAFILIVSTFLFIKNKPIILGAWAIFNVFYILFYYLGTIIVIHSFPSSFEKKLFYLLIMGLYILIFNIGYTLGRKVNFFSKKFYVFILKFKCSFKLRLFISLYISIPLFLVGLYFFRYGIPVFSENPEEIRKLAISGAGLSFLSLTLITPILIIMAFTGKRKMEMLCLIFFLLLNFLTAFKSAIARLLVIFFMYKKTYVNLLKDFIFLCTLLFLMFLVTYTKFYSYGIEYTFYKFYKRIFFANPHDLWFVINYFEKHGLLLGKAFIMDLMSLKPGRDLSFDGWMYQLIYNTNDIAGINASVGELWADWGWGAFFIIFIWGIILGNWDKIITIYYLSPPEKFLFAVISLLLGLSAANLYKAILVLNITFLNLSLFI